MTIETYNKTIELLSAGATPGTSIGGMIVVIVIWILLFLLFKKIYNNIFKK